MGDTNDRIWNRQATPTARIRGVVDQAEDHFWNLLSAAFPECTTGNITPDDARRVVSALEFAADAWLKANSPQTATKVATCELRVVMRLPKKGERMWWVSEQNAHDATDALSEVIAQSEELGFAAGRDITTKDSPDENGMVAVTIEIARASP